MDDGRGADKGRVVLHVVNGSEARACEFGTLVEALEEAMAGAAAFRFWPVRLVSGKIDLDEVALVQFIAAMMLDRRKVLLELAGIDRVPSAEWRVLLSNLLDADRHQDNHWNCGLPPRGPGGP